MNLKNGIRNTLVMGNFIALVGCVGNNASGSAAAVGTQTIKSAVSSTDAAVNVVAGTQSGQLITLGNKLPALPESSGYFPSAVLAASNIESNNNMEFISSDGSIDQFSSATETWSHMGNLQFGTMNPISPVFDSDGNAYYADRSGNIYQLSSGTTTPVLLVNLPQVPDVLQADNNGNVYAYSYKADVLYKIDTTHKTTENLGRPFGGNLPGAGDLKQYVGIDVNSAGDVFIIYSTRKRSVIAQYQATENEFTSVNINFDGVDSIPMNAFKINKKDELVIADTSGHVWLVVNPTSTTRLDTKNSQIQYKFSLSAQELGNASIDGSEVNDIYIDSANNINVGTAGGTLARYVGMTDSWMRLADLSDSADNGISKIFPRESDMMLVSNDISGISSEIFTTTGTGQLTNVSPATGEGIGKLTKDVNGDLFAFVGNTFQPDQPDNIYVLPTGTNQWQNILSNAPFDKSAVEFILEDRGNLYQNNMLYAVVKNNSTATIFGYNGESWNSVVPAVNLVGYGQGQFDLEVVPASCQITSGILGCFTVNGNKFEALNMTVERRSPLALTFLPQDNSMSFIMNSSPLIAYVMKNSAPFLDTLFTVIPASGSPIYVSSISNKLYSYSSTINLMYTTNPNQIPNMMSFENNSNYPCSQGGCWYVGFGNGSVSSSLITYYSSRNAPITALSGKNGLFVAGDNTGNIFGAINNNNPSTNLVGSIGGDPITSILAY